MNRSQRRQQQSTINKNDINTIKTAVQQALQLAGNGKVQQADKLIASILHAVPENADLWHLRSQFALEQKQLKDAARHLEQALKRERNVKYLETGGHLAKQQGDTAAELAYWQEAAQFSDNAELEYANCLLRKGDFTQARGIYERLLLKNPNNWQAPYNCGVLALREDNHAHAIEFMKRALSAEPTATIACQNLVMLLLQQGEGAAAQKISLDFINRPENQTAANLDLCLGLLDYYGNVENPNLDAAEALLSVALKIDSKNASLLACKGRILGKREDVTGCLKNYLAALELEPHNIPIWTNFINSLDDMEFLASVPGIENQLIIAMSIPGLDPEQIGRISFRLLNVSAEVRALEVWSKTAADTPILAHPAMQRLCLKPFFIQVLQNVLITSPVWELLLAQARKEMLQLVLEDALPDAFYSVAVALAHQCALNEYVYAVTPAEEALLDSLKQRLEQWPAGQAIPAAYTALYACYRHLITLGCAERLETEAQHSMPAYAALIEDHITAIKAEHALRPQVQSLTGINDAVSQKVQAQYEENPYPRWRDSPVQTKHSLAQRVISLFPTFAGTPLHNPQKPRILVAGCGTGRHACYVAEGFYHSDVTAVDLSRASLAYGLRKQKERGYKNLTFYHGDILSLPQHLSGTYDHIECVGVLHHMADPIAGWKALLSLLHPNGTMNIGLYSERARSSIVAARAFIKERGFPSTPEGIRAARQELFIMRRDEDTTNPNNPGLVSTFTDFYTMSMCRDLIFHVQEHRFTIPKLKETLASLGLEFMGFSFGQHHAIRRFYREHYPSDEGALNLDNWHELEEKSPGLFRSMYQFYCRRIGAGAS